MNRDMKRVRDGSDQEFPLMCNFEPMLLARLDMDDWYSKVNDTLLVSWQSHFIDL